jgi:predicted nucleic acid-binding protein
LIVDASAFVELLLNTPKAAQVRSALGDRPMHAPDFMAVEVTSVIRKFERTKALSVQRCEEAIADLSDAPVRWLKVSNLSGDCWQMRNNISTYDGFYVALANELAMPLVTADLRLAAAPNIGATVIAIE